MKLILVPFFSVLAIVLTINAIIVQVELYPIRVMTGAFSATMMRNSTPEDGESLFARMLSVQAEKSLYQCKASPSVSNCFGAVHIYASGALLFEKL